MADFIISGIIFFGGSVSLLFSLGQLFIRPRRLENYNLTALFFCLGTILFQLNAIIGRVVFTETWPLFFFMTLIYAVSPVLYFAYHLVALPDKPLAARNMLVLLAPTFAVFLGDILFIVMGEDFRLGVVRGLFRDPWGPSSLAAKAVMLGAGLQITVYLGFLVRKLRSIWYKGEKNSIMNTTLVYCFLSISAVVFIGSGFLASSIEVMRWGALYIATLIIATYFVGQRHPRFLQLLMIEAKKKKYERSQVKNLSIDRIVQEMSDLMIAERLYVRDDITLKMLADRLSITPHQLSELLNERLCINFNAYVNKFRIDEARDILLREPEASVLSIAYVVGFNSKSAFFKAFTRATGMTPQNFRRESSGGHQNGSD